MIPLRVGGCLYHYDGRDASWSDGGNRYTLDLVHCVIQKITRRGCWVYDPMRSKRIFIGSTWRKRHAWPTKSQALESLVRKKRRHLEILGAQMERAQGVLYTALAKQRLKESTA